MVSPLVVVPSDGRHPGCCARCSDVLMVLVGRRRGGPVSVYAVGGTGPWAGAVAAEHGLRVGPDHVENC